MVNKKTVSPRRHRTIARSHFRWVSMSHVDQLLPREKHRPITTSSMGPEPDQLSSLSNPLATIEQLSTSSSQLDGVPADLESSLRFAGAQLTQAAGILLRLPQEIIAQAVVILYRFYVGSEGGSFRINAVKVPVKAISGVL